MGLKINGIFFPESELIGVCKKSHGALLHAGKIAVVLRRCGEGKKKRYEEQHSLEMSQLCMLLNYAVVFKHTVNQAVAGKGKKKKIFMPAMCILHCTCKLD